MIEDMQARNLAPHTQRAYLQYISQFARYFRKSPDLLAAVLNATDTLPVAPRHSEPRLTESDWQQVAELVISSQRE
jgi:hypothetical protein